MKDAQVLIVEDDEGMADFATRCLGSGPFQTEWAPDGRDGLRKALASPPDVILLDLLMPGMHGFELCQTLRAQGFRGRILVCSGKRHLVDHKAATALGADGYLEKPYTCEELLSRLRSLLGRD